MKLVISPAIDDARLARVREAAPSAKIVNATDSSQALREMAEADAFFGKLTPELLAAAGRLRWVQTATASLEHYLFPALVEHPCQLTNMRGLYSDVIADQTLGYVICLARNFPRYMRQQMEGRWEPAGGEAARSDFISGPGVVSAMDRAHLHLADCTLGIVGLGAIGREIARRARAFGMTIVAVDPQTEEIPPGVESLWPPQELPKLLGASDFVVIAAPHTPETEGLFRRAQFEQMKRTAYLINIGRGAIVVLDDLTQALGAGQIAGAALDVCEIEPLPPDHPLWRMDNVIITPHVAGCATVVAERHLDVLVENVGRFSRGEALMNLVRKDLWY
ncbi:MAG: D-2-hydroxyacid dehydrogenase [Pirellulales bacterium]|nr:D-2-hydroxyacid dehydrogenase [Pirellulales bacterium]